jgi:hypothetical protein
MGIIYREAGGTTGGFSKVNFPTMELDGFK